MRLLAASVVVMGLWSAGCGAGDFCDSDVSALAGTWQMSLSDGAGTPDVATVVIDENGEVSVTSTNADGWSCDLTRDQVCDLAVSCSEIGGSGSFSFTLQKK